MRANTSEVKNTVGKQKKGTLGGHLDNVSPFPNAAKPITARAAKTSVEYWKGRVRPRKLKDGIVTAELYFRVKEGGRDAWINLDTADRAKAARTARDLWVQIAANGLDSVLASLKPDTRPDRVCTVGEFLPAARAATIKTADTIKGPPRERTLVEYEAAFRRVVAAVLKIERKSFRPADLEEWRNRIDRVRLDQITPDAVKAWRNNELEAAKKAGGEQAVETRKATINGHIRDAKSFFPKRALAELGKAVVLPTPLPFEGVGAGAVTRRFEMGNVNPKALVKAAAGLDLESRVAFDLLLFGGLRRGEADLLLWDRVSFKEKTVKVEVTQYHRPKSKESIREIPLPNDVVTRLRRLREANPRAEFVLSGGRPRTAKHYEYRAKVWKTLAPWLREQGLQDGKVLHSLRKISGSIAYASPGGIETARKHLGHSTIATTAASYVATKEFIVRI